MSRHHRYRIRHHYRSHMPMSEEQRKNGARIMKIVLAVVAAFFAALFIYRYIANSYIKQVRRMAITDYPDAELVQVSEGAALFPDRVRAVFWDREYQFLFLQDYLREGLQPVRGSESPESRERRLTYRKFCDQCIAALSKLTSADYSVYYDTNLRGFSVLTTETDPEKLNSMLHGLQAMKPAYPLRFSIVSCPAELCEIIRSGDPAAVMKDPRLAVEADNITQGEVMLLRMCADELITALGGDWTNSLEYSDHTESGVPADYRAADYMPEDAAYAVTELESKTGQDTADLRSWSIQART